MSLWSFEDIARSLGVAPDKPGDGVCGISIDSRTLKRGELFIALSGTPSGGFISAFASSRDGHDFVLDAAKRGAAAAIVNHNIPDADIPLFIVSDTLLDGLWRLAASSRARTAASIVAVTGSAGKSSTKELIAAGAGAYSSPGSFNNFWGLPLSLARMPENTSIAVFEVGMNQPGEIERLGTLLKPNVAVITNVRPVHVEALGSVHAIWEEKTSISRCIVEGGALVIPFDLELPGSWEGRTITFGKGGDIAPEGVIRRDEDTTVQVMINKNKLDYEIFASGDHGVSNSLAAIGVAIALGLDTETFARNLRSVQPLPGRGVVSHAGGITLIDDSFNANPASMEAALRNFSALRATRKIAVLGDMLELGVDSRKYHQELAAFIDGIDVVWCVGLEMRALYETIRDRQECYWTESSSDELIDKIGRSAGDWAHILVKGSKKIFWSNDFFNRLKENLVAYYAYMQEFCPET